MVMLYGEEFALKDLPMYGVTKGKKGIVKRLFKARERYFSEQVIE